MKNFFQNAKNELSTNGLNTLAIVAASAALVYLIANFNEICAALTVFFRL